MRTPKEITLEMTTAEADFLAAKSQHKTAMAALAVELKLAESTKESLVVPALEYEEFRLAIEAEAAAEIPPEPPPEPEPPPPEEPPVEP